MSKLARSIGQVIAVVLFVTLSYGTTRAQVRVMPGEVKDTRRTDGFFNKLEVEMKVVGDILSDAKGVRVNITKAIDETGKNLIPEKEKEKDFDEVDSSDKSTLKVELELKNPSRQALAVQEISGTLEFFIPKRDPAATATIPELSRVVGQTVVNPALKAAGIEVSIWNKEQYEGKRKAEEERLKKAFEEKKKKAAESGTPDEDLGDALANGLMKVFGGLFSAMTDMGENGLALQIKDPRKQLISIEFRDATGKEVSHRGRTSMGGAEDRTVLYEFEEKLPPNTQVKLFLMTANSVVKLPFKLTSVPLP